MKKKYIFIYGVIFIFSLINTGLIAQSAVKEAIAEPLYLTGGYATPTGISLTLSPLISPDSETQIWNVTKGTSGNGTDKYFIKSKNEGIPINTQGMLKLTALGGVPVADGKFHAHTFYRIGDIFSVKVAAGVADATTTYSAKFWNITDSNLLLTTSSATYPATADYVIKFIPYLATGLNSVNRSSIKCYTTNFGVIIKTEELSEVSIFSLNGQRMKEAIVNGSESIDLPNGMYIVRIMNTNANILRKIVVL